MAGVFDIELHDAENVDLTNDSDDDAIEVEEVSSKLIDNYVTFQSYPSLICDNSILLFKTHLNLIS
jgi:hypothetical protein